MKKRRNGAIAEFNKIHWFWKLMLISGSFGVIHAVIRRAKGEPSYYEALMGPPEPDPVPVGEFDPTRNPGRPGLAYEMPHWLRRQMEQRGGGPYPSLSSAPMNDEGSWQSRWDRFTGG